MYVASAAKNVGKGTSFVDDFQATVNMYTKLGNAKTNALYLKDHTYTSLEGGDLVAQAFVQAVAVGYNGTAPLKQFVKSLAPAVF